MFFSVTCDWPVIINIDETTINDCLNRNKVIEVAVDENNIASLRLFENAGFTFVSKEGVLLYFIYQSEMIWQIPIWSIRYIKAKEK